MPRGVDQGPAEGAVAEKGPSSAPVGLRENVAAPAKPLVTERAAHRAKTAQRVAGAEGGGGVGWRAADAARYSATHTHTYG